MSQINTDQIQACKLQLESEIGGLTYYKANYDTLMIKLYECLGKTDQSKIQACKLLLEPTLSRSTLRPLYPVGRIPKHEKVGFNLPACCQQPRYPAIFLARYRVCSGIRPPDTVV